MNALKPSNKIVGVKPLPRKLLLHMDNYVKDNKNRHLLAFLSLLIACEVFEEVQSRFLIVGHTHEDIDGSFGYLSKNLRKQNNYVMVDLLKAFMFSRDPPFILQLIQEILDFKSWVNEYLNDGLNVFVDYTEMHLFQFFMEKVRWLMMQYKLSHTNALWSLKDGLAI